MKRQSLGFTEGMLVGMSRSKSGPSKIFDWDRAARLIAERKPKRAEGGLAEDWDLTSGTIYERGEPLPTEKGSMFFGSHWATPLLVLDGEEIECWLTEDVTPFTCETFWPDSARAIVAEGVTR